MIPQSEMTRLTQGMRFKSEKIRVLANRGVPTADIARFLDIRYQFAYNVIKNAERAELEDGSEKSGVGDRTMVSKLDSAGRIVLPAALRAELGISEGDELMMMLEGDEIRLTTRAAGVRRAQDIVCRYLKLGDSLADELIAERRKEARAERD